MKIKVSKNPFYHYLIEDCLPKKYLKKIIEISDSINPSESVSGTRGDIKNRFFINKKNNAELGNFLNNHFKTLTKKMYKDLNNKNISLLNKSKSRLEITHDGPGFWQIPHLDEKDKLITIIVYLGENVNNDLGTDVFNKDKSFCKTIPYGMNLGFSFVPSKNSWHGFRKGKFTEGTRKLLIVNFVLNWKSTNELY